MNPNIFTIHVYTCFFRDDGEWQGRQRVEALGKASGNDGGRAEWLAATTATVVAMMMAMASGSDNDNDNDSGSMLQYIHKIDYVCMHARITKETYTCLVSKRVVYQLHTNGASG